MFSGLWLLVGWDKESRRGGTEEGKEVSGKRNTTVALQKWNDELNKMGVFLSYLRLAA